MSVKTIGLDKGGRKWYKEGNCLKPIGLRRKELMPVSKKLFLLPAFVVFILLFLLFSLFTLVKFPKQVLALCDRNPDVSGCNAGSSYSNLASVYITFNVLGDCNPPQSGFKNVNHRICSCYCQQRYYSCPSGTKVKDEGIYGNLFDQSGCILNDLPEQSSSCTTSTAACTACCQSLRSPTPTPLACPKVQGYCSTSSTVRVYWNGVPGAYSYRVYRDGTYKANVTTNGYTDIGVSCGVQHTYNVNPFPSGGTEKICKQNVKLLCPCPTKILPPPM